MPPYSVVVPGALPGKPLPDGSPGPSLYCAVIVKTVDAKTRAKTRHQRASAGIEGRDSPGLISEASPALNLLHHEHDLEAADRVQVGADAVIIAAIVFFEETDAIAVFVQGVFELLEEAGAGVEALVILILQGRQIPLLLVEQLRGDDADDEAAEFDDAIPVLNCLLVIGDMFEAVT